MQKFLTLFDVFTIQIGFQQPFKDDCARIFSSQLGNAGVAGESTGERPWRCHKESEKIEKIVSNLEAVIATQLFLIALHDFSRFSRSEFYRTLAI